MFGTMALGNEIKMLSARKAGGEGHSADAIAGAFSELFVLCGLEEGLKCNLNPYES